MSQFTWEKLEPFLIGYATRTGVALMRVLLIVVVAWLSVRAIRKALQKLESVLGQSVGGGSVEQIAAQKRAKTLTGLLRTFSTVGIWVLVGVICLDEIGLDIGPILAGAGIVGLAIGFGAQYIVRDLIAGFFLVLENQVHVGDLAEINGIAGTIESVTFRTVILRDATGAVHVIPNGSINTLANSARDWSACVFTVGVGYQEDTDRVVAVMQGIQATMTADPVYGPKMIEPIEVFGIEEFGDSAVVLKARMKTRPGEQAAVGREYRRRLKHEFDRLGIEMPFPQRQIHLQRGRPRHAA